MDDKHFLTYLMLKHALPGVGDVVDWDDVNGTDSEEERELNATHQGGSGQ